MSAGLSGDHSTWVDVLVLGAGPAGCAAAITARHNGLSVLIIEKAAFPRDRPGETLHPGVEPLLRKLEVWEKVAAAGFLRHERISIKWNAAQRFESFGGDASGPWQGMQAWRGDFDGLLLDRALEAGAELLQPCQALRPLTDGENVVGVETDRGPVRAGWMSDAGGGRHWLARQLALQIEHHSPPLIARYGYVHGREPELSNASSIEGDELGWTWKAQVKEDLVAWCRMDLRGRSGVAAWRPASLRNFPAYGPTRGADVSWRIVSRPVASGYFMAGDAAAVLDPASSHGVLRALMTGMMSAHLIAAEAGGKAGRNEAADYYCEWLHQWFDHDVSELRELYAALPHPPDWLAEPRRLYGAKKKGKGPTHENRSLRPPGNWREDFEDNGVKG